MFGGFFDDFVHVWHTVDVTLATMENAWSSTLASFADSQPVATQPATFHADGEIEEEEVEEEVAKPWGRLFPVSPEFETLGS